MGRLTFKDKDCIHYERKREGITDTQLVDKLGQYEDLDEQCAKENSWNLIILLRKWKEFIGDIQELYEYRKLEEQKKLLKLPFAVGDTVYMLNTLPSGKVVISELEADAFFCALSFIEGRFAKTVFLTKSEAENALQKMNEMEKKE